MLKRHKILLSLLLEAKRVPSLVELMKWLFLLRKETCLSSDHSFYDFLPYKYGPCSFIFYRDLEELRRFGFLDNDRLELTPLLLKQIEQYWSSLPVRLQKAINTIIQRYSQYQIGELLNYIYDEYPWFASDDKSATFANYTLRNRRTAVFTAGYEGKSIDLFLQKLLSEGIERAIDVRSNPISRKYGFSKKTLASLCKRLDIEYVHFPELGIPTTLRSSLSSYEDYQGLLNRYERDILPKVSSVFQEVLQLQKERRSVLICFESDARRCHRSKLAEAIAAETEMEILHL